MLVDVRNSDRHGFFEGSTRAVHRLHFQAALMTIGGGSARWACRLGSTEELKDCIAICMRLSQYRNVSKPVRFGLATSDSGMRGFPLGSWYLRVAVGTDPEVDVCKTSTPARALSFYQFFWKNPMKKESSSGFDSKKREPKESGGGGAEWIFARVGPWCKT